MEETTLYKLIESAKRTVGVLLQSQPQIRELYTDMRGSVREAYDFHAADEEGTFNAELKDYCLNNYSTLNADNFNGFLMSRYDKLGGMPETNPMEANTYLQGIVAQTARDLELMKRVRTTKAVLPSIGYQAEMSKKNFKSASRQSGDRYTYEPYFFTDKANSGLDKEVVRERDSSYSPWKCPIKRTWHSKVYLKGLATTDIAGKSVMTLDADQMPKSQCKFLIGDEVDHYKVYTVKVGYAKSVSRAYVKATYCVLGKGDYYCVQNVTIDQFKENNPGWEQEVSADGVRVLRYGDLDTKSQNSIYTGNYNGSSNDWAILHRLTTAPGDNRNRITYRTWQQGTVGFVEERFIAAYQDEDKMSVPKIACGTSPLRAVSVLRNRITKDVAKTMGVQ